MVFLRIIILLVVVFCASWLALSFDSAKYWLSTILMPAHNNISYLESTDINDPAIKPSLLPISTPRIKTSANTTKSPVQTSEIYVANVDSSVLAISSLGLRAPIVFEPTTNEDRIYKGLEKGVVHYSTTPRPGQSGTSIIIGHSSAYSWYKGKYGQIFSQLSKLQAGDVITIEKGGQILNYQVSRSLIFSPKDANDFELREFETSSGSSLVLMTCWPTGSNSKRVAVKAELI